MQRQANSQKHSKKVRKITSPNKTFANPGFTTNFRTNKPPKNQTIPPIKNILQSQKQIIKFVRINQGKARCKSNAFFIKLLPQLNLKIVKNH